jgi:hypothetical protein
LLLNKIWALWSQPTNYFCPQHKLVSKVRDNAKVPKKYDTASTPHSRGFDISSGSTSRSHFRVGILSTARRENILRAFAMIATIHVLVLRVAGRANIRTCDSEAFQIAEWRITGLAA